jgi:hypothetical protein
MAQIGNKQNSHLNGLWAAHARKRTGEKRQTSKARRRLGKAVIAKWNEWRERKRGR